MSNISIISKIASDDEACNCQVGSVEVLCYTLCT